MKKKSMAEILAFIAALPKLWDIYKQIVAKFGPNWEEVVNDIHLASSKLREANTLQERDDALSAIARAIHKR